MRDLYTAAMTCLYSRAYHSECYDVTIFDDYAASMLLTPEESENIPKLLLAGLKYNKKHIENKDEELKRIINLYLSPSPLSISAFSENELKNAVKNGAKQYLIFGAGYDTFSIRQPEWAVDLEIFEFNDPNLTWDKRRRLSRVNIALPSNVHFYGTISRSSELHRMLSTGTLFSKTKISFVSVPYLMNSFNKEDYKRLISTLSPFLASGSRLAIEYPNSARYGGFAPGELAELLAVFGFEIEKILTYSEMMIEYFFEFNEAYPETPMSPPGNLNYCLAEKKDR